MKPFKYNPNYNTGQFRHRITFQSYTHTKDDEGFPIEGWVNVKTAWAMIKTVKGQEFYQAATTKSENTYRFVIRYQQGLDSDMRILYRNRPFEIESILNDDEAQKTLTIVAKEVV